MNTHAAADAADLAQLALTAVDQCLDGAAARAIPGWSPAMLSACVGAIRASPGPGDRRLVDLAAALALTDGELLTLALVAAVEGDPGVAHAVAGAQAPLGGGRPLTGLMARALGAIGVTVIGLAAGRAARAGLLVVADGAAPLSERALSAPAPVLAALAGLDADPDGARLIAPALFPVPAGVGAAVTRWARALSAGHLGGLAIRTHSRREGLAFAAAVARAMGRRAALLDGPPRPGLGPWLLAAGALPVHAPEIGAGDRWRAPVPPHVEIPWLAVAAPVGVVEADAPFADWTPPTPAMEARRALWRAAGLADPDAARAATSFRQGAGRIDEVAGIARGLARADGRDSPGWRDVARAVSRGCPALDAHARISPGEVAEDALVLPARLDKAMRDLLARARARDRLDAGLGPAIASRYRPGVRALFVGESGTGKTLAAHWFAARLGLPLYRVDLGALTSKWIGETEKNISSVLGAAADADAVLFFDEADALFAARTEIGDANDRHANAQTNHLLQRIEEFDGIALLASNSRQRFDPAFVRRLDAILDFPLPEGAARAALWRAHLGAGHGLTEDEIDRLAVAVDLAGGHIRNVVLSAAAKAVDRGAPPGFADFAAAVAEEYGKLGKPPPLGA